MISPVNLFLDVGNCLEVSTEKWINIFSPNNVNEAAQPVNHQPLNNTILDTWKSDITRRVDLLERKDHIPKTALTNVLDSLRQAQKSFGNQHDYTAEINQLQLDMEEVKANVSTMGTFQDKSQI